MDYITSCFPFIVLGNHLDSKRSYQIKGNRFSCKTMKTERTMGCLTCLELNQHEIMKLFGWNMPQIINQSKLKCSIDIKVQRLCKHLHQELQITWDHGIVIWPINNKQFYATLGGAKIQSMRLFPENYCLHENWYGPLSDRLVAPHILLIFLDHVKAVKHLKTPCAIIRKIIFLHKISLDVA